MTSFLPFELFVTGVFLGLGWHATRRSACHRSEYVTAFLYALLFEELDIRIFKTYHYGDGYLLMFGQAPLVIAFAWAVIIYTGMQLSDCCDVSDAARAGLDALLAVLIDLSVDAIAIRRGYWQWHIPLNAGWFGVPAGNLYAWMFVVFFFSLLCRKIRPRTAINRSRLLLYLLVLPGAYLGLLLSLVAVGVFNGVLGLDDTTGLVSVFAIMSLFLIGLLRSGRRGGEARPQGSVGGLVTWIRLSLHGFFMFELLLSGLFLNIPLLLLVSVCVLIMEIAVHWAIRRAMAQGMR